MSGQSSCTQPESDWSCQLPPTALPGAAVTGTRRGWHSHRGTVKQGEESDIVKCHVDCVLFWCWGNAGKDLGPCCGSFRSHSPGCTSLTTALRRDGRAQHFNRIPEGRASAVLANSRRESCVPGPSPGAIQQVHTIVWVRNDEGPSGARSTLAKPSAPPAPSASAAQRSLQGAAVVLTMFRGRRDRRLSLWWLLDQASQRG